MSTAVRRAIYGKLAGDTTLTSMLGTPPSNYAQSIYYHNAPDKAGYPFVILNRQSGLPTQETFNDPSAVENDIWLIKGVDRGPQADVVEAIQARIAVLLNDAALSISGVTLRYLRRQSDVDYPEVDDGQQYRHAGSLFRLVTTD